MWKSGNGASWTHLPAPQTLQSFTVDRQIPSAIYVTGWAGVHRSTDGGASWTNIYSGRPDASVSVRSVAIDPVRPSRLYLMPEGGALLTSVDSGATWQATGLMVPRVGSLAIDPNLPSRLYASTGSNPSDVFVTKIAP